tara:strand:- start:2744 stop:8293 length:5550 start_codon:yes stop_codon:yes gene_type:complete
MPLNKLDNFIKNTDGRILYVSPSDLDSTDSISNEGTSLARPFKTIQRALIEAARFSYVKGRNNDLIERSTVMLMPGEHVVDNRPGEVILNDSGTAKIKKAGVSGSGSVARTDLDLNLGSNFDLTQDSNILYKFNSVNGGVIVPRGTSIVGQDLRKTRIRPLYVPNPTDDNVPSSSIFRITGTCYFWQFSVFDGNDLTEVYTDDEDFSLVATPIFSHHKLTVFEYADGVNKVEYTGSGGTFYYDLTDLDMYYAKISNAYNEGSTRPITTPEKYPEDPQAFDKQLPEFEIVGAFASDPVVITSIFAGDGLGNVSEQITVNTATDHNLDVGTPIKIRGVGGEPQYNISTLVSGVSNTNSKQFFYSIPGIKAPFPNGNTSAATVTVETDTVKGASPYIFNCSMRSVYGMNGMKADGSKCTGFRSMVVAQFTGISLQKDDRAFVKYDDSSRSYTGITYATENGGTLSAQSSATGTGQAYHLDSSAVYRPGWETCHIDITNDAVLQIVSVFAIGYTKHFAAENGGDASITNSNSNFGQLALVSEGFKKESFSKDDKAIITSIIPPRAIETTEEDINWLALDITKTKAQTDKTRLYLQGYIDQDVSPPVTQQGYKIGARVGETLYLTIGGISKTSKIVIPNSSNQSSKVSYNVLSSPSSVSNSFTISATHTLEIAEKVIVRSETGDYPQNIEGDIVYYIIKDGLDKVQLASSYTNAIKGNNIIVSGGTELEIVSRVTDKTAGDAGHPVQYSSTGQVGWYINTNPTGNDIWDTLTGTGPSEISVFKRIDDTRSLDEKIYKVRVVIPSTAGVSKNPEAGFAIQPSSNTGARSDADFTLNTQLTEEDYFFERNPRFIATCTSPGTTSVATIRTEIPHDVNIGDTIIVTGVTDTENITGVANTGYNGTFVVSGVPSDMEFSYECPKLHGTVSTNNSTVRSTALPRYSRNNTQSNLYIYRNEQIAEYIKDTQDGVYHLYVFDAKNAPPEVFTSQKYSQNVVNLYPQLDRDNVDANPRAATSFAKRSPIGDVVTNDLKYSLTRESVDDLSKVLGIGKSVASVTPQGSSGKVYNVTFSQRHGFLGISTANIKSGAAGSTYNNGTYQNVKILTGSQTGTWQGATANVTVSGTAVNSVEIVAPGSDYSVGDYYFDQTSIGSGNGAARLQVFSSGLYNAAGGILQFTGVGTTDDTYASIDSITNETTVQVSNALVTDAAPVPNQIALELDGLAEFDSVSYSAVTDLTTFTTSANEPHGVVAGNQIRLQQGTGIVTGDYFVQTVTDPRVFAVKGDVSTATMFFKLGYAANENVSDSTAENLSIRAFPLTEQFQTAVAADAIVAGAGANTVRMSNFSNNATTTPLERFPYGSYFQIDDEIFRVALPTLSGAGNDVVTVIRGALATQTEAHDAGSLIRKIKPIPIEFRRPSLIRCSGHTFEYLGFGPGNYSTSLPQVQDRTLTEREEFLSQSQEKGAGIVVYTGMNSSGDFYIGNRKTSSSTGEITTYDTPVSTVTGQIPSRLSSVFDELVIKERLVVEGGDSTDVLSQFDGPVTFNKTVKVNDTLDASGRFQSTDSTDATSSTDAALTVTGGVGIGLTLRIDGDIISTGSTISSNNHIGAASIGAGTSITAGFDWPPTGKFYGDGSKLTGLTQPGSDTPLHLNDNIKATFGNTISNPDLVIFHDLNNSIIREVGTGNLYTQSDGNVYISGTNGTTLMAKFANQGNQELYHTNADDSGYMKISTHENGAKIGLSTMSSTSNLYVYGDIYAFYSSDQRLKDNIKPIDDPLAKVLSISGNTFDWNEASNKKGPDVGVIAQEVDALGLPGITTIREDGTYAVRYEKLVPVLIEAIKELSEKVDNLEQKLSDK